MSTAIMQTGALQFVIQNKFYDWQDSSNDVADLQLKDQFGYGAIAHQQQQQQPHIGANRMTQAMQRNSVSSNNVFNSLTNSELLQNQINAAVMQQQQQAQQQKMLHNALTRTTSHQPTNSELQLLQSLQSDTMSATECHRKLERTQSEPAPQVQAQMNTSSRYKTELCRPFKETGECKYGEKCQFAHGENELRTVQRHPKYKTEYCRTFYGVGLCPYGSRCHFLHDLSGEDDGNTRTRNGREQQGASIQNGNGNGNGNGQQQRFANKDTAGHTFGRNITSSEEDAIRKAATIPSRPFGRSASVLNGNGMHPLPMSPPLSMSTGSDRASPICSLSPTNSISNFQFTEPAQFNMNNMNAINSMANGIYSSPMNHITPPASPQYSPPATPNIMATNAPPAKANNNALTNAEKARLPIFNQISCASTIDTLKNLPL